MGKRPRDVLRGDGYAGVAAAFLDLFATPVTAMSGIDAAARVWTAEQVRRSSWQKNRFIWRRSSIYAPYYPESE